MKKIFALLLALALALSAVSALAEGEAAPTEENAAPAEESTLLVTINGKEIRTDSEEISFWMKDIVNYYGLNEDQQEQYKHDLQAMAMAYVTDYAVAETILEKDGKAVTDEQISAELQKTWDSAIESNLEAAGVTPESTEEEIAEARKKVEESFAANYGYTEESFLNSPDMRYSTRITLTTAALEKYIPAEKLAVTEEDIDGYYQTVVSQDRQMIEQYAAMYGMSPVTFYGYFSMVAGRDPYYMPEGFRGINHILLKAEEELQNAYNDLVSRLESQGEETGTEPAEDAEPTSEPVTQEMVDAARKAILDSVQDKLTEINEKLANGAAFEDLILEYGTDPGMTDELTRTNGYEVHQESQNWESNFQKAAMALENVGDISDPVVSSYGVHILKYVRDIPGGAINMPESARETMAEGAAQQKRSAEVARLIAEWTEQSEIIWTEAGEGWKATAAPTGTEEAYESAETEETAETTNAQ